MQNNWKTLRNKKQAENRYSFVAREEDVDYLRVVREAPQNAPFILMQETDRFNQPKRWCLFVHESVLANPKVNKILGEDWGSKDIYHKGDFVPLHAYRVIGTSGKIPNWVRREVNRIQRKVNPPEKNTKVRVEYL